MATIAGIREAYLHWQAGDSDDETIWEWTSNDFDIAIEEVWQSGFDAGVRSER